MEERRRFVRLHKVLPIKISDQGFDILTETNNISANGAYCPVNKPLELMTKLDLVILLSVLKKNRSKEIKRINCKGIVVRNEAVSDNDKYPFKIAIYFNDIKSQDRKLLDSYIKSHLKI